MKQFVVTIDGPAGAGKTTVSRALADRLDFDYVDTGALYRGVAYLSIKNGIDPSDDAALDRMCAQMTLDLVRSAKGLDLWVDGENVSGKIRTPQISMTASAVSARPGVRAALLSFQRALAKDRRSVFEGRDMGTVVFPEAQIKFFLDADPQIRATRRYRELSATGKVDRSKVVHDMQRRDRNDRNRSIAPLRPAEDAVRVDSTDLEIEDVVAVMARHVAGHRDYKKRSGPEK